ncbi:MAG: glutamine-hydrolyzing GMP synthase, partial [Litorivicinus sp.]
MDIHAHRILILDFGSQYTQLIARRVREIGVYCEIYPCDVTEQEIIDFGARGIILSGGPESATEDTTWRAHDCVWSSGVPVLGICYGMQTMAAQLGGTVETSDHREFGHADLKPVGGELLDGLTDDTTVVWMSHGDRVTQVPPGFEVMATSAGA